ncbi:transient receptor potential cation channel subfamily A member 1 isoform X2 [Aplysia californica]|uniref:Transient receptor potential cation channel subfamily A member 1 isoform X2 n=1 Tax=Aplysia californica TaxID=6500 RepID=A0ABM0ZZ82_APLCA|nr:transient receptor potential cation channel subfamily A member 1 isoform X2 [Aplysia californica]
MLFLTNSIKTVPDTLNMWKYRKHSDLFSRIGLFGSKRKYETETVFSSVNPRDASSIFGESYTGDREIGLDLDLDLDLVNVEILSTSSYEENPISFLELFQATADGDTEKIGQLLLAFPTRINIPNSQGNYLIHIAIDSNRPDVLSFLLSKGADVNVTDQDGKTALHHAVVEQSPEMVGILVLRNARTDIKDIHNRMPLHTAAEVGNVTILERLLPHYVNPNMEGDGGYTALHYAASRDCADAVRFLIKKQCLLSVFSECRDFPIHVAGKTGSANAVRTILEECQCQGFTKEGILRLRDRERNMPIHSAVNGGSIEAVKCCLQMGSSLICKQEDGWTPLHFAAMQGNLDMVVAMYNGQTEEFRSAVCIVDGLRRTPLHCATLFNHTAVMKFLLDKGANINAVDDNQFTPLLLAASKGKLEATKMLINYGADTTFRDRWNRNLFHLLILSNKVIEDLSGCVKGVKKLYLWLGEKDRNGCTALHYAARYGNLSAVSALLSMGASLFSKNFQKQSPFHVAAMYGRRGICKLMLDTAFAVSLKNEPDGKGLTPLHLAAQNGYTKIVSMLMERGAVVGRDHKDNTPLHLAALNGRVDCVNILLNLQINLIDSGNNSGNTALHFAASNGHTESVCILLSHDAKITRNDDHRCFYDDIITHQHAETAAAIVAHERWREILSYKSAVYGSFLIGLIQKLPSVCQIVLDRCVEVVEVRKGDTEDHAIRYNFDYLNMQNGFKTFAKLNKLSYKAMYPLQEMVTFNRVECLSHPLCVRFLRMKWRKYGLFIHFFDMTFYLLFLACLTCFVVTVDSRFHTDQLYPFENFNTFMTATYANNRTDGIAGTEHFLHYGEIYYHIHHHYFTQPINLVEWVVYLSSVLFILPFLFGYSTHLQWAAGAVAIFFAWFNCLVSLQRFDLFGIYVVMFLEIMKTLVHVVFVFSFLNIAFGLAFYVLLSGEKNEAHSSPSMSVYRTLILLLEIDFINTFNRQYHDTSSHSLHFDRLTYFFLAVFIFLMPILLINLLIGLAVGDIESVQRGARLKRLATQVKFHAEIEDRFGFLEKFSDAVVEVRRDKTDSVFNEFYSKTNPTKLDGKEPVTDETSSLGQELKIQKAMLKQIQTSLDSNQRLMSTMLDRLDGNGNTKAWDEGADHSVSAMSVGDSSLSEEIRFG